MGHPQLPQRPIPPVHHVWVAGPGDARRLFRGTLSRTPGLIRLGIIWAICLALIIVSVVIDYAALRPPRVVGSAVLIQNRRAAGSTVLPRELVPPEALTFLQQRTGP